MPIHAEGVFMGKKIQRILISLKETEKQKNNGPQERILYFLKKLKYLRDISCGLFFFKICGHLGNEEGMCVCGGRV